MKYAKWVLVGALMTLAVVTAAAQIPAAKQITAQVPFTFVVADHTIPLGECRIQSAGPSGNLLVIRSPGARVDVFATASKEENKHVGKAYSLIFHKYGMRYYLAGVRLENSRNVYWITTSSYEKELLAQNTPATEEILLASAK